jgi:hypothetical protein
VLAVPLPVRAECTGAVCPLPEVGTVPGALVASYVSQDEQGRWTADNTTPAIAEYTYRLLNPCSAWTDNDCRPDLDRACDGPEDRVIRFLTVQRRSLALPGGTTADGLSIDPATPIGTPVGDWQALALQCIDITALNPAPSPEEVFRYFQRLPLPQLPTHQQPPGDALVGLPVVFFTDGPTTQTYSLDIRGFTVDIVATAESFTWHTGDGTDVTSTDPGAPYPDHTVTYDYASGTYTASLTTTWSGTFSVDGSASVDVPGTTTTDGPPVTFRVVEARAVLTNPYD